MSIDSRLRNGLHGAAEAVTPDTASALREVRRRATRRRRTVFVARIAVAAAVTAVIFSAGPIVVDRLQAPEQVAPAAPASLVGTYVVDVAEGEASYMLRHDRALGGHASRGRRRGVRWHRTGTRTTPGAAAIALKATCSGRTCFPTSPDASWGTPGWPATAGCHGSGTCASSPSAAPAWHSRCCSSTNRGRSHRDHAGALGIARQRCHCCIGRMCGAQGEHMLRRSTYGGARRVSLLATVGVLIAVIATPVQAAVAVTPPQRSEVVREWNLHAVNALTNAATATISGVGQTPPVSQLHLAMVQGAVNDAVNAIEGGYQPYLRDLPRARDRRRRKPPSPPPRTMYWSG